MTDPEVVWQYLGSIPDMLWYEDEWGEPLHHDPLHHYTWEAYESVWTVPQKRCIANCLTELLKIAANDESAEVGMEADRIEYMLTKYWNAYL